MRKLLFVLICTFTLLTYSCQNYEDFREIDSINNEPEFAVPLVHSSLSIQDIIEDQDDLSFLSIAADGSMSVNYTQDKIQQSASELIQDLEDFPIVLVDSFMSVPVQLFENLAVSQLHLKSGTIEFDIQSSHTENIDVNIIFPGMIKNGIPFQTQTVVNYQGETPVSVAVAPQSMENYSLSMPNGNLEVRYEAFNEAGQRVLLDIISGEAKGWEYSSIEGSWAQESFTVDSDTIEIDLFEDWVDGQISFEDPKLIIELSNSIGFPVQMRIQNMMAHTADGNSIPFNSVFSDGYNMSYPALNEMGQEKTDQITLDKNNSNIISIFNARPNFITYEVVAMINPEDSEDIGFISETSMVSGNISLDLPIYGTASNFTIETASEFELEEIDEVSHAEFKLITDNSIPMDLELQLYFTDDNDVVIDSLFDNQQALLVAPDIGANGTVLNAAEQTNIISVTGERFDNIQTATQVKVKATVSTANDSSVPVKILSSHKVEVRMGAKIGLQ